jgi:signal transduction histidine kinase
VSDRAGGVFPRIVERPALPDLTRRDPSAHRVALTVAAAFALAGLAWVLLTDVVLYAVVRDRTLIARFETAKGWIFITLASLLLYAVTYRSASRLDRVRRLTAAIVDSIGDGVLLLGPDRTIAHANPAAVRMLRCPREDLIGMGAVDFSRRFRVSDLNGALMLPDKFVSQRVFEEGGPIHFKEVIHPPSSNEVVISATAAGVHLEVEEPAVWVVSVMHDITDSEYLERLRDQFFAAAAHSLKTPVAIVKANVELLMPAIEPRHQRIAASIDRQCERIDRLVQNLLVLARAHSRALELHPSETELGPLVDRIACEQVWSHRHDVRAEVTGAPAVIADQERLALAIRNLMYEATRLSPADSSLTLMARVDGDQVAIGVRYHPLPWRDRASEPYGEYDDIGIGRSVAKTIVQGHGGSLSEEANDAETTSWIHLPAQPGAGQ